MLRGNKVTLADGAEYTVPSLTYDQVEAFRDEGTLGKIPADVRSCLASGEAFTALVDVSFAAFHRNYPDVKRESFGSLVDMEAAIPLAEAVLGVTGLLERAKGEAKSP